MINLPVPLPTNIIPYWFFPWNTPSWPGYSPFIFHKEIFVIDAVRQMFVWKVAAFALLRQGVWPLWNPYNFAGQPFLANFQTSVFYPLSWGFLFLPPIIAWSIYILSQPFILALGSFLFFQKVFTEKITAILAAIGITFTAFFSIHYFWGVSSHPLIWLPFSLFLTELFRGKKLSVIRYVCIQTIIFFLILLGGYPQSSLFSLGLSGAYFLFRVPLKGIVPWMLSLILATGIAAIQLLPTLELYQFSPREGKDSQVIVENSFIDPKHLIMTISPDFFGSPATNNYNGGRDYSGVSSYFGICLLPLSLLALFKSRQRKPIVFWTAVAAFGLIMALPNPVSHLPSLLKIPILGSGAPWYYLLFFQIGMVVLAGYGLEQLLDEKVRSKTFISLLTVVSILLVSLLFLGRHSSVAINNTLKIALVFGLFLGGYLLKPKLVGRLAIILTLASGLYFWQRVMPFGDLKYFYPPHPLVQFLQDHARIDRFWGPENARLPSNLGTYYQIQQPEGYDSLWPKRYGQLVAAAISGKIPDSINRAEVLITNNDNPRRDRLLKLLGVKYYLDKSDNLLGDHGPNPLKFSPGRFSLSGQWGPVSVYEDRQFFPRAYLVSNYIVKSNTSILPTVYDQTINLRNTVVLEKDPQVNNLTGGSADITNYGVNKVDIRTQSHGPSILFLSDNYFPGWDAFVNGKKQEILRADYTFRAVVVPSGTNAVSFRYEPQSFRIGEKITLLSLLILCLLFLLSLRKTVVFSQPL